ncbi:hypothetical protein IJU97_05615 [bacterium]|nr:hypothetical protein [bacterium]
MAWEDNEAYNLLITVMPDIENFFNEFKIKQSLFKNNYYKLREYAI